MICTPSYAQVLARAKLLDEERSRSGSRRGRGPLHGIPIVVKDQFCTRSLGMDTTCGSFLLKGQRAIRDAVAIQKLQDAGAIMLAKANLTELGYKKGIKLTSGWSAVGGQTQSPYVRGGVRSDAMPWGHSTPAGSSSGSAVAVAAGFCPVAIGTENDGSVMFPATRAGLYGFKPSRGKTDYTGVQPGGKPYDTIGVMAKGCEDIASVMNVLMDEQLQLRLGESWKAMTTIEEKGAQVFRSIPLITMPEFEKDIPDTQGLHDVMTHPFRKAFEDFLFLFPDCPATTLKEVIKFNNEHAYLELPKESPDQDLLVMAEQHSMKPEVFEHAERIMRTRTTNSLQDCMEAKGLDVIIACGDGLLPSFCAAAGCPIGAVPLGSADFNGRAFGLHLVVKADQEERLLSVMRLWEETFPDTRKPPDPTPYPAATTTDVDEPSATDKGGYVQTSMPTTGVKGVGAARMSTGERAQAIAGAAGLGECPTTTIGKPKCYRYAWEFPPKSAWVSLDCLISHARPRMVTSSNDGPNEADNAIAAVKSVAGQAGIDPRIAFAVMMQESSGKVRPVIGDAGKSYGLFQVQRPGIPLCNTYAKNQCPKSVITSQVENGIYGHNGTSTPPQAPGLAYWMRAQGGHVGRAVRGYNTGSVPNPNDLTDATATRSYASDIANRLVGGLQGVQHKRTCPTF
ncbi:MAG: hypothetical protein LQ344_007819 [Seirophora lacunosa]|nr:MAG: hypothetical protein LQ344_007819 [Seirophora lacunosa]